MRNDQPNTVEETKNNTDSPDSPKGKSRRSFLKYLLSIGFIGFISSVLYPLISYLVPPKQSEVEVSSVNAGKVSDFAKNSGKIIKFGNEPVIVLRKPSGEFKALSAVCTHLSCTVQFRKDWEVIWCACHNGKYDLNGKNISGPPPRPLTAYNVNIQKGNLFISKKT